MMLILLAGNISIAQDNAVYQKKWFVHNRDTMPFRILLPQNMDANKKYPLVFFLHGSGERGKDNVLQLLHGSKLFSNQKARESFPAIVIFPQCSVNGYWSNVIIKTDAATGKTFQFTTDGLPTNDMQLLIKLVTYAIDAYPVDNKRVSIGGLSMGGMGVFEIARRMQGVFAAAFPICGGAQPSTAKYLTKINWWIFHGDKDDVVLPAYSKNMFLALQKQKANVKFTLYPLANHNSWDAAFAEPNLLSWLFAQHKP